MTKSATKKRALLAVQVAAVNDLHYDMDGECEECRTPFPCRTRRRMREARTRKLPVWERRSRRRHDAQLAAEAAAAEDCSTGANDGSEQGDENLRRLDTSR